MNKTNWKYYRDSQDGKRVIGLFDCNQPNALTIIADGIFAFQERKMHQPFAPDIFGRHYRLIAEYLNENIPDIQHEQDIDQFLAFIDSMDIFRNDREKLSILPVLSVYLYINYNFFKPILFTYRFDYFLQLCANIGVELPEMTRSRGYREYFRYYHQLCGALSKFQEQNQLTDEELCACLYDYADTLGEENSDTAELPQPTNIWLTGANKEDVINIEKNGLEETIWACNERTRRGDIIIVYARTPNSCLYAIGRAKSDGFFNPFDYYQCRAVFSDGRLLPRIPFKELKEHPYISQIPIFKKNLQGINGVELTPRDYAELVALIREHGFTEELPKLLQIADYDLPEVGVEKDVEEKILIPFLSQMGYTEKDYTRQLVQQLGRKEKGISDFVFFPKEIAKHTHRAPFLIETKYDMRNSSIKREKAFRQAFSYANDLHCSMFAICDKERFVLYAIPKIGAPNMNKPIFDNYWANIETNEEVFMKLKNIIGRDVMIRLQE
ncbi:MAG: restriction endonuclease subunit R [Paludibacteraceae bacterium]